MTLAEMSKRCLSLLFSYPLSLFRRIYTYVFICSTYELVRQVPLIRVGSVAVQLAQVHRDTQACATVHRQASILAALAWRRQRASKSAPEDLKIPLSIPHVRTAVLPQGFAHSALRYLPVVAKAMAPKTGTTRSTAGSLLRQS